jgi:dTDP-glucose 4,6-dehydratase
MKILVTGADGFIGSHLTELLLRRGHEVRAMVMYNSVNSWGWLDHLAGSTPAHLEMVAGDIRDPRLCDAAVEGCDRVLHLAALIAIPHSFAAPDSYVDTNVRGTLNLLNAARNHAVKRFVHTSTSEVYGSAQFVPIDESHPLKAQSPYAASKIAADQFALSFHASFALPVVVARPFNTYGPRQSARAVIPTIITQLAKGPDVSLGATSPTRDFCFVEDTAAAFASLCESDDGLGEVFNFGSGFEISIGEVANLISTIMNRPISVQSDQGRLRPNTSEVERLSVNSEKFQSRFGWNPEFGGQAGLRRGLQKTVEWFVESGNLARYKPEQYNT